MPSVAFGPDGQLATAGDDGLTILWPDPRRFEDILKVPDRYRLLPAIPTQPHPPSAGTTAALRT